MARVLNPEPRPLLSEPVELSGALVAAAMEPEADPAELERLSGALHGVDPFALPGDDRRIAFWLNVYNALFRHEIRARPRAGSLLRHFRLFDRARYRVGGHAYSLNQIEHGVLRLNARRPLPPIRSLRGSDQRLRAAPSRLDPRIHFALNCGARSCPPIRFYDDAGLDAQLRLATRSYLEQETALDPIGGVLTLPRLMKLYAADFGDRRDQVAFAARHLPDIAGSLRATDRLQVGYGRYDWTIAA